MHDGARFCSYCGASFRYPSLQRIIEDARATLDANPDDAAARHNLALAYKLGGMDDLALREFARVVELQPDFGDAHFEIALLRAKRGDTEEAIAALDRVLKLEPDHERARRLLSRLRGQGSSGGT
jgi:tetratricopeptide (TPR) repeat protein